MANNPKKVKDPTEVALSAIQEALNISDTTVDTSRNSLGNELAPQTSPSAPPPYSDMSFDTRGSPERPVFDPIEEPRSPVAPPTTIAKPSDRFCRRSRRAALPAASTRSPPSSAASGCSAACF